MKLVFDILGATEMSGGMRLHATEVIRAWASTFPNDELVVMGPQWAVAEFGDLCSVRLIVWKNEHILHRFVGQVFVGAALRKKVKADFLISLSPIVSPFAPRRQSICFQHDWRHIKNPDEFPALQKMYRKLWVISAARSLTNACISEKTRTETLGIVPGARTHMVPNGGDHPARWHGDTRERTMLQSGRIVTFGHHNNKRPHLVMEGLAQFLEKHPSSGERLVVLGARGEYRETLRKLATALDIESAVSFPGFVSNEEYQETIASARCVVLASSDEGYGLPVAEADYFGIPAIGTSDSGLADIFNNLIVAEPTAEGIEEALERALSQDGERPAKTLPSWADTVSRLRTLLASVAKGH